MNVHHLELFYYVAKYEGITAAVRKMPYGIQQPAVSGQLLQLEKDLGVKLFHRRPFGLTPAGDELYDFVYPFFSRLDLMEEKLTGMEKRHLRIGSSSLVLATHIPEIIERLKQQQPELRLTLRETRANETEAALAAEEIDLAIVALPAKLEPGLKSELFLELPLKLLCPPGGVKRFEDLLPDPSEGNRIAAPLIAMPGQEALRQLFRAGLRDYGVIWEPTVEVSTLDLVRIYTRQGYGYGLAVEVPGLKEEEGQESIPLREMPPLRIGVIHRGKLKPLCEQFLQLVRERAEELANNLS